MSSKYDELKALVETNDCKTEPKCQPYLEYVQHLLIDPDLFSKYQEVELVEFVREKRLATGDNDTFQVARVKDETKNWVNHIYVWELKAPQYSPFQVTTKYRAAPTHELVEAENQLIHFIHDIKDISGIKKRFNITDDRNIHFGGIVIGREDNLIKSNSKFSLSENDEIDLYSTAKLYRENLFWENNKIRLLNWDRILSALKDNPPVTRDATGDPVAMKLHLSRQTPVKSPSTADS